MICNIEVPFKAGLTVFNLDTCKKKIHNGFFYFHLRIPVGVLLYKPYFKFSIFLVTCSSFSAHYVSEFDL